jgi:NAD(P)-dependent dehydrogenase (short-subunit alcohol dehydrogenase family)
MGSEHYPAANKYKFSLNDKVAIVTGAGRGIGYAVADVLSSLGARVMLQDIDTATLSNAMQQLQANGREALASQGDVSSALDIQTTVDETLKKWGRVDILVNNAGIGGLGKKLLELSIEEWQRMIEVDLTAVFLCCRSVLPSMIQQGRGAIINIASITALMGVAGSTHYAAAKAGVIGFSKSLAREVAEHHINVNVVAPGLIDTQMSRARGIDHQRQLVIWPRIGNVEDIAWAVAYLASDQAEFITGEVLNVNGGAYM